MATESPATAYLRRAYTSLTFGMSALPALAVVEAPIFVSAEAKPMPRVFSVKF